MYNLVARNPSGKVVGIVPVERQPLTIGRSPENSLILPGTVVSRKHASIYVREDGRFVINDEGSANGIKVNGQYISGPTIVDLSSQIQISTFSLHLETEGESQYQEGQGDFFNPDTQEECSLDTVLEPHHTGTSTFFPNTTLQLVGRGGPYDGTVFTIDKPLMTVGRVQANNVVLDDPSISRRHAQIRLSAFGSSFTVLDLRSSNGTFVNGQRVKRSLCTEDSIIRFGDLAFKVAVTRRRIKKTTPITKLNRRKIVVASIFAVALILSVAIIARIKQSKKPTLPKVNPVARLKQIQTKVQDNINEGRRLMTQKDWSAAIVLFDKVQADDPLNNDAKRLRQEALEELGRQKIFEKGSEFYALGQRDNIEKAKEEFSKIPKSSVYYREVRYPLESINERLAQSFREEGVSRCKARYWKHCQKALCRFFELIPAEKTVIGENRLRRELKSAEKKLSRKRISYTPCSAQRFIAGREKTHAGANPSELLAQRYSLGPLKSILMLYYRGQIELALKQMNKLIQKRSMRPHLSQLKEVNRQLVMIHGKYQEGYSAFRERDVVGADKHWSVVLRADQTLIPEGLESFFQREVKHSLGDLYYELGDENFKVGHFQPAFTFWFKGKQASPGHERIMNGLMKLEKAAEQYIRQGERLLNQRDFDEARKQFDQAKEITEKGSSIHNEALAALQKLSK